MKHFTIGYVDGHTLKARVFETIAKDKEEAIHKLFLYAGAAFDHLVRSIVVDDNLPPKATPADVAELREAFPAGCRVVLDKMNDPQAPPTGTKGTVKCVDDAGSIAVSWDTGGSLSVAFGVDKCHRFFPNRKIYVASRYAGKTEEDVRENVAAAIGYCKKVLAQDFIPVASHLMYPQMLDDNDPAQRQLGLSIGHTLIADCDEVWVFGKISSGVQAEIEVAKNLGLPVRYF